MEDSDFNFSMTKIGDIFEKFQNKIMEFGNFENSNEITENIP